MRLAKESRMVHYRALKVRISPGENGEKMVAEFLGHPSDGRFMNCTIVLASSKEHKGSSPTFRSSTLDFGVPFAMKRYDKMGYKMFLKMAKHRLFGDGHYRMTKSRCEEFFDNDDNFVL